MAKQNLLSIVQDILNELVSDEVNSISDTNEALVVANIVKRTYLDIINEMDLPSESDVISLQAYSDTTKPSFLKIPENVSRITWVKYDTRTSVAGNKAYTDITWMAPDDFISYVNARPSTDTTNYQVVNYSSNVPLIINKKVGPAYWTSFDDETIIFDNYNSAVDSTLQASKSLCYAELTPDLVIADATIPALPGNLTSLLYTMSLTRAAIDLNKEPNVKGERNESRMRVRAQRNKWRQGRIVDTGPNYGRK
jgi:hypothetical protein